MERLIAEASGSVDVRMAAKSTQPCGLGNDSPAEKVSHEESEIQHSPRRMGPERSRRW